MKIVMYSNKFKLTKKVVITFFSLIIIISAILLNLKGSLIDEKSDTFINVNSTPITNKTIIIDAGHGKPDEGAESINGVTEEALTLSISKKLQKLIEQSSAKALLTRSDENGIYSLDSNSIAEKKVSDIKNRVKIGNSSSADIFVSIHLNKYPQSEIYKGWQTFYQDKSEDSKKLATFIQNNITKNINIKNDRIPHKITDVYIMNNVTIPTVIVECGFLSNNNETALLKTDEYQNKLAWGIYLGIQEYFN